MIRKICFFTALFIVSSFSWSQESNVDYDKWLKEKFQKQHEELLPIVAVADMFFGCNRERHVDKAYPTIKALVSKVDRNLLAEKLSDCLQGEMPNSDTALNFGLVGCFHAQLEGMPEEDRKAKQKLVAQAIKKLSKLDRQKSFTHCVTDQAISYLK